MIKLEYYWGIEANEWMIMSWSSYPFEGSYRREFFKVLYAIVASFKDSQDRYLQ